VHRRESHSLTKKQGSSFTAAYAYGNGLIRKDGEYPMFDGLGSTRTTTNSSQTVTATAITEGFGATIATTGSTGSAYGFAGTSGYRNDGDAGLMHTGARYYDAQVGRFITRDTKLNEHPYLYCEHDPVNWVDPSGHGLTRYDRVIDWIGDKIGGIVDKGAGNPVVSGSAGVARAGVQAFVIVWIVAIIAVVALVKKWADMHPPSDQGGISWGGISGSKERNERAVDYWSDPNLLPGP
jgi:RHS repeat-associated protein